MRDRREHAPAKPSVRPIVTLTTDFGLTDHYVAAMKAALVRECPEARLIDVTHNVPRHDILFASITLERARTDTALTIEDLKRNGLLHFQPRESSEDCAFARGHPRGDKR